MTLRKGLILITFAWTIEVCAVFAGLITAMVSVFGNGTTTLPGFTPPPFISPSLWPWLLAIPMGMIAVAELGRIPLTSVLYQRNKQMQIVALIGIVFLAGIAIENWFFGFERIVEMRLAPASAIKIKIDNLTVDLENLQRQREDAAKQEAKVLADLQIETDINERAIAAENKLYLDKQKTIHDNCVAVPYRCMGPEMIEENARHEKVMAPLNRRTEEIYKKKAERIRISTTEIDKEISATRNEINVATKERNEILSQNQIYRIAAMVFRRNTSSVTDPQFDTVRFWFCAFSAVAVSLAGTTAALVYYAAGRTPTKYGPIGKMVAGIRAYFARLRGKIYVTQYRGVKYVEVPKPVVVRPPYLVFVPWFFKYPMQIAVKDGRVELRKVNEVA